MYNNSGVSIGVARKIKTYETIIIKLINQEPLTEKEQQTIDKITGNKTPPEN